MPMKELSTSFPTASTPQGDPHRKKEQKNFSPKKSTLRFLRLFARNCYIEPQLPEGVQGIILS